jgi:hypothetical protein
MAQNLEKEYANDNLKIKMLKHTTTGIKKQYSVNITSSLDIMVFDDRNALLHF